jgi:O-antigen ligase
MRDGIVASRNSWWAQALQNRLIALVLAMVVIVPLIATPADPHMGRAAAMTLQGFAIVLMVALFWRLQWNVSREKLAAFFRTGANLPVTLFGLLAVVSCALSPYTHKGFSIQETMQIGAGILLYFVVAYRFRQSKHLSLLVDTLLFLAASASLIGIAQYNLTSADRATALFGNDQLLGSFLMILLPIVAVVAMAEKAPKRQIAAQIATVLTVGCLLLTQSRSSWIGAAAGLLTIGVLSAVAAMKQGNLSSQKHKLVLPIMLAVVSVGFFAMVGSHSQAIAGRAATLSHASGDTTVGLRLQQWQGAVKMIKARPLGWGPGMFAINQYAFTGQGQPITPGITTVSLAEQAHNFYLQTAADFGLPGLFLMLAAIGTFLVTGLRRVGKMDPGVRRNLLMGSIGAIISFSFDAISSPSWQFGQIAMFFWLMLGIGVSCTQPRTKREEEAPVVAFSPRAARFASVFGAVALTIVMVPSVMACGCDCGNYNPPPPPPPPCDNHHHCQWDDHHHCWEQWDDNHNCWQPWDSSHNCWCSWDSHHNCWGGWGGSWGD